MAAPFVQAVGAVAEGVAAVTPSPPTHQADDILLAYAEHAEGSALTTATSGWAAVADSPVIQTLTAATTLDLWWKRATAAGTLGPTFDDPGNHIIAVVLVIRGCITTGNPWDVTAPSTEDSDTTISVTGDTTTVADCLILNAVSTGLDLGTDAIDQFSAWADSALTSVTEQVDVARTVGNGGMLGIASGVKATAGAYGPMTATLANAATKAMHSMALKPAGATVVNLGQAVETDTGHALSAVKALTLGQASQAEIGHSLVLTKTVVLGIAVETDTGHPLTIDSGGGGGVTVNLGQAVETDTGHPLAPRKTVVLGLAVETDVGLPLTVSVKAPLDPFAPALTGTHFDPFDEVP